MDPVTAIGVASAVVQFIDFGTKLTKRLSEYSKALPGDVPSSLKSINITLPLLIRTLSKIKTANEANKYDEDTRAILAGVVVGCFKLAREVEAIIDKARAKHGEALTQKLKKAVNGMKLEERVGQISRGLEAYIQVLILHQVVDRGEITVSDAVDTEYFEVKENRVKDAVSRTNLLKRLEECFHEAARGQRSDPEWVILQGDRGVGKTQLALQYCDMVHKAKQYRTIFWLDASTPELLKRGLENASALVRKTRSGTRDEKLNSINSFLVQRWSPWLLVLDNYVHKEYDSEHVASLLPTEGLGSILITTTSMHFPEGMPIKVDKYIPASDMSDMRSTVTRAIARKELHVLEEAISRGLSVDSFAKYMDGSQSLVNFAAAQGFGEAVTLLLKNGANPSLKPGYGSVITKAAYAKEDSIVQLYLDYEDEHGRLMEQDDYDSEVGTLMIYGNVDALRMVLKRRSPDIKPDSRHIWNQLSRTANEGHLETIKVLHSLGKLPEAEKMQCEMLCEAVKGSHLDLVRYLISEMHVNVNGWGLSGEPALFYALQVRDEKIRMEMVQLLVGAGASADVTRRDSGRNSMHYAATYELHEHMKTFLEKGADVTIEDDRGDTPLLLAADWGKPSSYPLLTNVEIPDPAKRARYFSRALYCAGWRGDRELALHAWRDEYVNAIDEKSGDAPLLAAIRHEKMPVARMFVRKGAKVDIKDKDGNTPLLLAAKKGLDQIISDIAKLKKGGSPSSSSSSPEELLEVTDNRGNTPLMLAVRAKQMYTVKVLLELGADRDAMNNYGETAGDVAEEISSQDMIDLLEGRIDTATIRRREADATKGHNYGGGRFV